MRADLAGVLYALAAYLTWGLAPLFWKELADRPPIEVLGHRIVWALAFNLAAIALTGRRSELRSRLRPEPLFVFAASASLVAINWFTFIFAVTHAAVLQASLGYFLNPLVNVLLGMLLLGEHLRRGQWLAVGMAALGVGLLASRADSFPWISLVLAFSFGLYGLVRKKAPAEALVGSTLETLLLAPAAVALLCVLYLRSDLQVPTLSTATGTFLVLGGAVTAVPLILFSAGVRRLTLTAIGFVQYVAPTCQFLLAVLVFREPFSRLQLSSFGLIWAAIALFTVEARVHRRRTRLIGRLSGQ